MEIISPVMLLQIMIDILVQWSVTMVIHLSLLGKYVIFHWGKINNIPITGSILYEHTAAVIDDKVYTFGGYTGDMVA